jgi:hypothetical protein
MDDRRAQQKQVNEAAEKFAEAMKESYQVRWPTAPSRRRSSAPG